MHSGQPIRRSLLAVILIVATPAIGPGKEPPPAKPSGFALEEALKDTPRPPRSGVVLETPTAEVVEKGGKKLIRVGWALKYAVPKWPLIILKPSLTRPAFGRTEILVIAKGKSGEAY